jgi:transposase
VRGSGAQADRGYLSGEEILACEQDDIAPTLPRPLNSSAKAEGRFGRQDLVCESEESAYRCPPGEWHFYRYINVEAGLTLSG